MAVWHVLHKVISCLTCPLQVIQVVSSLTHLTSEFFNLGAHLWSHDIITSIYMQYEYGLNKLLNKFCDFRVLYIPTTTWRFTRPGKSATFLQLSLSPLILCVATMRNSKSRILGYVDFIQVQTKSNCYQLLVYNHKSIATH